MGHQEACYFIFEVPENIHHGPQKKISLRLDQDQYVHFALILQYVAKIVPNL